MSLSQSSIYSDTNNKVLLIGNKTITTTQSLLAVSASNNTDRQFIRIYNSGTQKIYIGTTGVTTTTGEPLEKDQHITIAIRDNLSLYAITATGTASIIIWELG
jgi:hypothetical protein